MKCLPDVFAELIFLSVKVDQLNASRCERRQKTLSALDPVWPKGTPQRYSKRIALRFFHLLGSTHFSMLRLLREYPELPPFRQLQSWRGSNPWFAEGWRKAREAQGEFLVQKCLEIAEAANPRNAHSQRVKFDILWKVASKFHPSVYGDKPAQQNTNIQIGVSISNERLNEIRSKLDMTRIALNGGSTKSGSKPTENNTAATTGGLPLISDSHTRHANDNDRDNR
jgi:hypothetical protein